MGRCPKCEFLKTQTGDVQLFPWLAWVNHQDPAVYRKCLAWIKELQMQGFRLQPPISKPLRDHILELRPKTGRINYRILYFFSKGTAVITHGLKKESEVPNEDIDYAINCRDLTSTHMDRFTATLPDDFFA